MQFTHSVEKLPKETYRVTAFIPWDEIQQAYQRAFTHLSSTLEVEGFRKGKAPAAVAEKHLAREKVYDQAIRDILPIVYEEIVKKEDLKPVVQPSIDLKNAQENEPWEIVFTMAGRPTVNLGDYKKVVAEVKKDHKKDAIWVPGKEVSKKDDPEAIEAAKQGLLNDILNAIMKEATVEISDVIIQEELNNRLSRVVDDVQKLGMTVESYLKSKKTTMDDLKAQLTREIEETHKIELLLTEIADDQNIQVSDEELAKLTSGASGDLDRQSIQQNAYFYAMILRKQKTLDYLMGV